VQVVNADVPVRDFWQVVLGSAAVSQQLSTVVAAVSVPVHLRLGLLQGHSLLAVNVLLLLVGEQQRAARRWRGNLVALASAASVERMSTACSVEFCHQIQLMHNNSG
jgi:hypothetical protein